MTFDAVKAASPPGTVYTKELHSYVPSGCYTWSWQGLRSYKVHLFVNLKDGTLWDVTSEPRRPGRVVSRCRQARRPVNHDSGTTEPRAEGTRMRNMVGLILGGGKGTRLLPLTQHRSKPAVPLAGKYRLIDIPISNCLNSGINRIYVLTQFNSVSLHRHIRQTYQFDYFDGGFVEILAAQQTNEASNWYQGTADAVRKQLRYIEQPDIQYVLVLSGDQLYRMDYGCTCSQPIWRKGRRHHRRPARDAQGGARLRHYAN